MLCNDKKARDAVVVLAKLTALAKREAALTKAAERFVAKVEAGRAHSVETYNEMKACLRLPRE